jgi:hypothetical protein
LFYWFLTKNKNENNFLEYSRFILNTIFITNYKNYIYIFIYIYIYLYIWWSSYLNYCSSNTNNNVNSNVDANSYIKNENSKMQMVKL